MTTCCDAACMLPKQRHCSALLYFMQAVAASVLQTDLLRALLSRFASPSSSPRLGCERRLLGVQALHLLLSNRAVQTVFCQQLHKGNQQQRDGTVAMDVDQGVEEEAGYAWHLAAGLLDCLSLEAEEDEEAEEQQGDTEACAAGAANNSNRA